MVEGVRISGKYGYECTDVLIVVDKRESSGHVN